MDYNFACFIWTQNLGSHYRVTLLESVQKYYAEEVCA